MMKNDTITRIEQGVFESTRPRHAGSNARLGAHGDRIRLPLVRLTTGDGVSGFGICRLSPEQLAPLLGQTVDRLFFQAGAEFPVWDLIGQREGKPVYALLAESLGLAAPTALQVPCYDTSLYFDDLHLTHTEEAVALLVGEARDGYERGHRAFKLKVGRGARHLPLEEGTQRDIEIIRAVRSEIGPECPLLIDANNGYNLNLAKRVLAETADCGIHWLEEAFHEDPVLYRDLKEWMLNQGLTTRIADGEGEASPSLLRWAQEGLIDVVQYDIFGHGLTRWLHTGRQLDEWGVGSAPHHYGAHYGNFVTGHLASVLKGFTFVEWDEARCPVLDTSAYFVSEGHVHLPALPGFGLQLDERLFQQGVREKAGELGDPGR